MFRGHLLVVLVGAVLCVTVLAQGQNFDVKAVFEKPVALLDADGKVLITGKALATPYAADFDADGVNDLILGAKMGMDTAKGGIWLVRNVGTNAQPRLDWANAWPVPIVSGEQTCGLEMNCGCKSAGYVPVQAVDWNADGWLDIVYTDTYRAAFLLINKKVLRRQPVFDRVKWFDFEKTNHGMLAGGGDWNHDGVRDFLHMPFGGKYYRAFAGERIDGAGLRFAGSDVRSGTLIDLAGDKAPECAWAWDFSGTCRPGQVEYVGVADRDKGEIGLFRVTDKVSRKVGTVATFEGGYVKLTACDLNADGRMDVLYSGGVFGNPDKTKVFVLYGKVGNMGSQAALR